MLRAAVIGIGTISEIHIHALQQMENIRLVGLCDINPARAELYPDIPFYTCMDSLLAEARPEVLHICLPHWLHYPVAKQAAKAGVHVFSEKPPALDLGQTKEFAELERSHPELRMGLCLQNRYNLSARKLLEIIRSGEAGKVTGVKGLVTWCRNMGYYRASPWRASMAEAGGGVMINQALHTLDLMQLFGGEIASVHGSTSNLSGLPIEVEDTACGVIRFASGAQGFFCGTVANSSNSSVELTVTLEHGTYTIRNEALWQQAGGQETLICRDERLPGEKFYYGANHLAAIQAFYRAVEHGGEDYIRLRDGLTCMQMIEAINQSSREQRPLKFEGSNLV